MLELIMSSIPKSHQSSLCLVRGTQRITLSLKNLSGPLLTATMLTCPHLTMSLHLHMPHQHAPHLLHITGPLSLHVPQGGAHVPYHTEVVPSPGRIPCVWFQVTAGLGAYALVEDRLPGLWNNNIWLQHNGAFNAQVKEVRRVPMHLSEGARGACSPQVYMYPAQGNRFSHYLAQDAGYPCYPPPQPFKYPYLA